jgi:hypothetical protein
VAYSSTLKVEILTEISVEIQQIIQRYIPEDITLLEYKVSVSLQGFK